MQRWPGQGGQCSFCVFRPIARRTSMAPRNREFSTQPALSLARANERSKTPPKESRRQRYSDLQEPHSDQHKRNPGKDRERTSHKIQRLSNRPSFTIRREVNTSPRPIALLNDAILQRLETLKAQLKTTTVNSESGASQFDTLDPNGEHWEPFKKSMISMVEAETDGKNRTKTHDQEALYRRLEKVFRSHANNKLWVHEINSAIHHAFIDHVLQQNSKTSQSDIVQYADLRYPTEWYASARSVQREIHLHVGPTNSGKTYNALKRLEESGSGFYCGPLRLLAHEVYARFQAKGMPCDLITGDDVRKDESGVRVKLTSSTVEMVNTDTAVDVAVIDEIQMMAHEERGWAWTRAFLGANAKQVHLCGETRVVPLVRELAASMGDTLHVHNYERLSPLKVMSRSLRGNLKALRPGDCVVSFSIIGIHAMKKQIEKETGRRVAIVYGSLPSETRAQQAALFNDPENDYDYLVASDAIGMGLNLAIKRIIFESIHKWNGKTREVLSIPQIKQISGRAGRYRTARQAAEKEDTSLTKTPTSTTSVGLVTCLEEADLAIIQDALRTEPEPLKTAGLQPPVDYVEEFAARLPKGIPFDYVLIKLNEIARMHPRFKLCELVDQIGIVKVIEPVRGMTVNQRYLFGASPADHKNPRARELIKALADCVASGKSVTVVDLPEMPLEVLEEPMSGDRDYLRRLEELHKSLILFLWLSYRFLGTFKDQEMAQHAKRLVEQQINKTLLEHSHSDILQRRLMRVKELEQEALQNLRGVIDKEKTQDSGIVSQVPRGGIEGPVLSHEEPSTTGLPVDPAAFPLEYAGETTTREPRSAHG